MPSKYTARGTVRLTSAERSKAMKKAWRTRRAKYGLVAKPKRKGPPDPVRSEALRNAWRRRWRAGIAPKRKKRVLLTPAERSEIAIAAAAKRQQRVRAEERKRKQAARKRRQAALQRRQEALAREQAEAARKATAARKRKRKAAADKRVKAATPAPRLVEVHTLAAPFSMAAAPAA